ncbi:MAG TPA: hypothetical protein PKZ22_11035 [Accumulibacter sp.]|nr:hypothetical protein [Accumulibacter sp.]
MSAFLIGLSLYVPLSLLFMALVAERHERSFLIGRISIAWVGISSMVSLVNIWLPFTGGGDDEDYYFLANLPVNSISDLFDIKRFADSMEQPGYPFILSLINFFSDADLLSYKLFGVFVFILISLTWYRIGVLLESIRFGRKVFLGVLFLTPLWFYTFFLLKDLLVVFLQSLFLLGLLQNWQRPCAKSMLLIGLATLAILPFRAPLILQNAVVFGGAIVLDLARNRGQSSRIGRFVFSGLLIFVLVLIASNPYFMQEMGVSSEHRVLGATDMVGSVAATGDESKFNPVLFPVIYVFSEITAFNLKAWWALDSAWLRGILALPWILFFVPFFIFGSIRIFEVVDPRSSSSRFVGKFRSTRFVSTPWGVLMLFVFSMAVVSFQVGDTARWRISDMPVIATVAMAGWFFSNRSRRRVVLFYWFGVMSIFFVLNNLYKFA